MAQNREREQEKGAAARFRLEIPLDASAVVGAVEGEETYQPDQAVKVVVQLAGGAFQEQQAALDAKGQGRAVFHFDTPPGKLRVMVGPGDASGEEISRLQTLAFDLSSRQ